MVVNPGDGRYARRRGIDVHHICRRGGTYVAGGIGGRCRVAVGRAVCESSSGVAPGTAAVGSYRGNNGATIVDDNGATGLSRAGESQRRIVGEAAFGHVP